MRHGTPAAYKICTLDEGGPCDGCRLAMFLQQRRGVPEKPKPASWRQRGGKPYENLLPAKPYQLVVHTLLDAGCTAAKLAELTGLSPTAIRLLDRGATSWIYPATADLIRGLVKLLPSESVSV